MVCASVAGIVHDHQAHALRGFVVYQEYDQQAERHAKQRHDDRSDDEALGFDARQVLALDDEPKFTHGWSYR